MDIRIYPDPVLKEASQSVEVFDEALTEFADEMVRTMHAGNGLGLAAPQVGSLKRLVIVSPDGEPGHETVMVNPEIVESSGWQVGEEGCLSFPGIYVKVRRFDRVQARYQDVRGEARQMEVEGLLARAVQHEIDHLDGRLLVDRMNPVQRMAQRRRLRELERRWEQRLQATPAGATHSSGQSA